MSGSKPHVVIETHKHPLIPGAKPKAVLHFDCSCGARCYEPHVWAYHVEASR